MSNLDLDAKLLVDVIVVSAFSVRHVHLWLLFKEVAFLLVVRLRLENLLWDSDVLFRVSKRVLSRGEMKRVSDAYGGLGSSPVLISRTNVDTR